MLDLPTMTMFAPSILTPLLIKSWTTPWGGQGIDYIHRLLVIRTGKGNEVDMKFRDSYEIKWSYSNALDIKTKIDELKKIDIIDRNDIFTFPLIPDKTHYKGILLFANVTKFEALLRNI